ncbi:hypothetical protein [Dyadobacter tibetensis]|uniref:hypothetical protein n=1 Tax=Dyadobacter tibetensis TaxID=1211851 RepID=UPI0004700F66|nr:hypothetical protein [Dyadobacter tibetensis]
MKYLFVSLKRLQRSIFFIKLVANLTLVLAFGIILASCSKFTPAEPLMAVYREVLDPNRDTLFLVHNTNRDSSAFFTFEESLSDTAIVFFSEDRSFKYQNAKVFPHNKAIRFGMRNITSDTIFIKYHPLKSPITGSLIIGTHFR